MLLFLLLLGCGINTPTALVTDVPGSTPTPISTSQPYSKATVTIFTDKPVAISTDTLTPVPVLEISTTVNLQLPSDKPVSIWNGIPIMPEAISGEEKEGVYSYTIIASSEQVLDFYNTEMSRIGWRFYTTGRGETGSLLLMYQKDDKTCTVNIFDQHGVALILLIQY